MLLLITGATLLKIKFLQTFPINLPIANTNETLQQLNLQSFTECFQ